MKPAAFLLDQWLDSYKSKPVTHDLASSTGARWTFGELLALLDPEERAALDRLPLGYGSAAGGQALREAIALLHAVSPDDVIVTTGASEAFHILFAGLDSLDEVLVPWPCFPSLVEIPRSLGLGVKTYGLRPERAFSPDLDEVARLIGPRTRMIVVNSPHNPSGTVLDGKSWAGLAALARDRDVTLVSDEVYWPLSFGEAQPSATIFPKAIVVGSLSKASSLSGLRLDWIIDRQTARREGHLNTRMYFTISNSPLNEALATAALRHRNLFFSRTEQQARSGRDQLQAFLSRNTDLVGAVPPAGGTVAFPWLTFSNGSRSFCQALASEGVLTVPGDCFGAPQHFRVGFAACPRMAEALVIVERVLRRHAALPSRNANLR